MACNYFFRDVLIGDEFQLNDFLIKNRDLLENINKTISKPCYKISNWI